MLYINKTVFCVRKINTYVVKLLIDIDVANAATLLSSVVKERMKFFLISSLSNLTSWTNFTKLYTFHSLFSGRWWENLSHMNVLLGNNLLWVLELQFPLDWICQKAPVFMLLELLRYFFLVFQQLNEEYVVNLCAKTILLIVSTLRSIIFWTQTPSSLIPYFFSSRATSLTRNLPILDNRWTKERIC